MDEGRKGGSGLVQRLMAMIMMMFLRIIVMMVTMVTMRYTNIECDTVYVEANFCCGGVACVGAVVLLIFLMIFDALVEWKRKRVTYARYLVCNCNWRRDSTCSTKVK